jgi:hypothetical protein
LKKKTAMETSRACASCASFINLSDGEIPVSGWFGGG